MITRIRTALRHDGGATAVEYGLMVVAIVAIVVGVIFLFGGKVKSSDSCSSDSSGSSASC